MGVPFYYDFINLLIPGAGFAYFGRWYLAVTTQLALIVLILLLCWSRLVFSPRAIVLAFTLIAIIYLVSTICCLVVGKKLLLDRQGINVEKTPKHLSAWLLTLSFMLLCVAGVSVGFMYKDNWLGIHIYFVPSMSMYPALEPGQFILVDTWAYIDEPVKLGDIVVFKQKQTLDKHQPTWLVKRITNWPQEQLQHDGLFYVLGDNSSASHDSRRFGGIKQENIAGKVNLVLFGIDNKQHLEEDSWLQPIN